MKAVIVVAFESTGAVMHTRGRMVGVGGKTPSISHVAPFSESVVIQLPCFLSIWPGPRGGVNETDTVPALGALRPQPVMLLPVGSWSQALGACSVCEHLKGRNRPGELPGGR